MEREAGVQRGETRGTRRGWDPADSTPPLQVREITFLKNTVMECDACGERGRGGREREETGERRRDKDRERGKAGEEKRRKEMEAVGEVERRTGMRG